MWPGTDNDTSSLHWLPLGTHTTPNASENNVHTTSAHACLQPTVTGMSDCILENNRPFYLKIKTLFLGTRTWHVGGGLGEGWDITPMKSANQGIKYLQTYQLPWKKYLDSSSWPTWAFPDPLSCPRPPILPQIPLTGNQNLELVAEAASFLAIFHCNKIDICPKHS